MRLDDVVTQLNIAKLILLDRETVEVVPLLANFIDLDVVKVRRVGVVS